ncbi:MAG: hypothetical protein GH143_10250 [Calditrichaeota bacterium]|nr:hypothetical protein [Calditrichota bacterium]
MIGLLQFYIRLIKTPQTALLLFTAVAGYRSAGGNLALSEILVALVGLLFTISGTTALNMVFDRDIDAVMERTRIRPIPTGVISPNAAFVFGSVLIVAGMSGNYWVSLSYATVVLAGVFFNLAVYTLWLKRRSPWSIVFGGLAGGMPILAGRALALGHIDWIGILLALVILLWIPSHILTLAMNHSRDYKLAGVPTFPNVFGFNSARYFMAVSNLAAAGIMLAVFLWLGVSVAGIVVLGLGSLILLGFSVRNILYPSERVNFTMFKFVSLYMAGAMLILIL